MKLFTPAQAKIRARCEARSVAWANSVGFVQRAALSGNDPARSIKIPYWRKLTRVYQGVPSSPGDTWLTAEGVVETPQYQQQQSFLAATDGFRLHAVLLPLSYAALPTAVDYDSDLDMAGVIAKANEQDTDGRHVVNVELEYLQEAIHPDAAGIQLTVGGKDDPVEVFCFLEDGTQISYALIMPYYPPEGMYHGQRPRLPARQVEAAES